MNCGKDDTTRGELSHPMTTRPSILTQRLLLRDVTEDDASLLFDLDSDSEVMRHIGQCVATDAQWYRERIRTAYLPYQGHPWHGV